MSKTNANNDEVVRQALRDADLYRALLDHLDEGLYMVDLDRRILYWNRGAERISGYLAHEVAGISAMAISCCTMGPPARLQAARLAL